MIIKEERAVLALSFCVYLDYFITEALFNTISAAF